MTDILKFHVDPFRETRWRVRASNGEPTLTLVQDLEQAAGAHDTYIAVRVREVASQLRRLLQIPGGAR